MAHLGAGVKGFAPGRSDPGPNRGPLYAGRPIRLA
jgi:hypothetical protein